MVERLTNLVGIFQKPELDFSQNRAEHNDILGDTYEYLMRHFATESRKRKGQFYTPSGVSCVIAQVIGISTRNTKASTTAYDPTRGSGSLLLKVAAQAGKHITLEGQEKDVTTAGLARMNMILHDFSTTNILSGNALAALKFKDSDRLRTYGLDHNSAQDRALHSVIGIGKVGRTLKLTYLWKCKLIQGSQRHPNILPQQPLAEMLAVRYPPGLAVVRGWTKVAPGCWTAV